MIQSSWPIDIQRSNGFLSNVSCEYRQLFEEAIANTGRYDIYCRDEPAGQYAHTMRDTYFSVWIEYHRDCSDFWDEVDRLRETEYWSTYISLAADDSYAMR